MLFDPLRSCLRFRRKSEPERFLEAAAKLTLEEMEKILRWSDRYRTVLKAVASGASSWLEVYEKSRRAWGPVSKSNLTHLLVNLVKYGYLERREDGSFVIQDPVVRHVAACF